MGVALSSSDCMAAARDSSSIIYSRTRISNFVLVGGITASRNVVRTFFCRRTTLVHFFSRRPSYFLTVVVSSTSSGRLSSSLSAAAVLSKLFAERYAIIDLCLPAYISSSSRSSVTVLGGLAALQLADLSISGSWCRLLPASQPPST